MFKKVLRQQPLFCKTRLLIAALFALSLSHTHHQLHANLTADQWFFHVDEERTVPFTRSGSIRGTPYICLPEIVEKLDLRMSYEPDKFAVTLRNPRNNNRAQFFSYSEQIELRLHRGSAVQAHPSTVWLSRRPEFVGAELCVPIEFGDRVLRPLFDGRPPELPLFYAQKPDLSNVRVVIDPGHGGNDRGAESGGFYEKDLVLLFSRDLKNALENLDIPTLLTRETDAFVTLSERARLANQSQAQLFLSIHMNSAIGDLRGFEIYTLALEASDSAGRAAVAREHQAIPDDLPEGIERAAADLRASANLEASVKWADTVRNALSSKIPASSSRSVRSGPFYVLYAAQMPALLVELGYITHPSDRHVMLNPTERLSLSRSLAQKIAKKLGEKLKEPPESPIKQQ